MRGQVSALTREIIDRVYPVHVILDFGAEVDPNSAIGCGTVWTRIADGRALIAADAAHPVGWTGGTEAVTLTVEQLPSHRHTTPYKVDWGSQPSMGPWVTYWLNGTMDNSAGSGLSEAYHPYTTMSAGGDQPHSNMQPSRAVCRWERTA